MPLDEMRDLVVDKKEQAYQNITRLRKSFDKICIANVTQAISGNQLTPD